MPKTKKTKFLLGGGGVVVFLLLFLFLGASFISAQKPLEVTYPQTPGVLTPTTTKTALPDYIRYIFQLSLFVGTLIAFGSLLYGGVRFLTSAGSLSVQKDAQSQISAGISGLIILFSAYIILNTINPQLVGWQTSLPGKMPIAPQAAGAAEVQTASYKENLLGGVINNFWGEKWGEKWKEKSSKPYKPAICYQFDSKGDKKTEKPSEHDRFDCIKWLSEAIRKKAENLKKSVEELQKLYDCQNCCRDCCKNVCNWAACSDVCDYHYEKGEEERESDWWWENCGIYTFCEGTKKEKDYFGVNCGSYQCCEEKRLMHQYYYQKCPYSCCEFFQECKCQNCGFDCSDIKDPGYNCNCICIKKDGQCCNPENPTEPWEDEEVKDLINKIKSALKELRLKLGLFLLTEELEKNKRIICPPDTEMGAMDCLLSNTDTKNLIKKILIGEPEEVRSSLSAGENWLISFRTEGEDDLTITPKDSATIDNLDFISLTCGGEERTPEILENDVIFYPDWSCEEMGQINHLVKTDGEYTFEFHFGEKKPMSITNESGEEELIINEEKLKEILKIKSVMEYLVENDLLSTDKNLAKIMLRKLCLLKNEVAINEIAWMGTKASPTDQWIELYNNTKEDIELSNWKLVVKDKFEINLSGTIPAQGFYLLENDENVILDITADWIYNGNLSDSNEEVSLYDEFGNLVEEITSWFAGDFTSKASMERINPIGGGSEEENWGDNYSIKVGEERKGDYINGEDRNKNPIYGTPKSPNSIGGGIISYPSFENLVAEMRNKLRSEKSSREKLILVLRQKENLEKMLKSKDALKDILVGDDVKLKNLLRIREVLQILLEEEENLNLLIADPHAKEVIKEILIRTGGWKIEDDKEDEWAEFLDNLEEVRTNSKLLNDFQRDLLWVLDASDLMRGCVEDPISYDQLRVPELANIKIEEVPEWKDISREVPWVEGFDPAIFYCHEPLWLSCD